MKSSSMVALVCAGLSLAGCATTPRGGRTLALSTMGDGQVVAAPRGFVEMCAAQPELCVADAPGKAVALDAKQLRETLTKVNRLVNSRVVQQTDLAAFGRRELWRRSGIGPLARGDCEDLAIEKRERLVAAGVPRAMLFFATAWRADLGLHTLLIARTRDGDLVLDSRTPYVQPWRNVPYLWISRQHSDQPTRWSAIEETPGYAVAAIRSPAGGDAGGSSAALSDESGATANPTD